MSRCIVSALGKPLVQSEHTVGTCCWIIIKKQTKKLIKYNKVDTQYLNQLFLSTCFKILKDSQTALQQTLTVFSS